MLDISASHVAADPPEFSVVVPVFDEAAGLAEFAAVMQTVGCWEAVYVNGGSQDLTLPLLEAIQRSDPHVAVVNLSRNLGKEIATTAGLEHARGTAVIVIDADLHLGCVQLPRDTGDFRLMSRRVVDAVLQLREQHRFMKGLFAWVGYPTTFVSYERVPRHAGKTCDCGSHPLLLHATLGRSKTGGKDCRSR